MVFVFSSCRILWISISTSSRKVRFIMFIIALSQQWIKPVQIFTQIAQFTRTALNSSPSFCALSDHLRLFQNLILRPNQVVHLPVFIHGDHSLIAQSAVEIAEPEIMLHVTLQRFLIQDQIASSTFNISPESGLLFSLTELSLQTKRHQEIVSWCLRIMCAVLCGM